MNTASSAATVTATSWQLLPRLIPHGVKGEGTQRLRYRLLKINNEGGVRTRWAKIPVRSTSRSGKVTPHSVNRALNQVLQEMADLDLLTSKVWDVPVFTQPMATGLYEGLYVEQTGTVAHTLGFRPRSIYVPLISWGHLAHDLLATRRPSSLRDVLRHELGHAFAVEHPSLVCRSRRFRECFGAAYDDQWQEPSFDASEHVTEYAANSPSEDFAEIFMTYLRCGGDLDQFMQRPGVARKMRFVRWVSGEARRRSWLI